MSKETLQHLNISTLIGNTDARGHAWHYRAEEQGEETNHYPGPIPVGDVERRLFDWQAVSRRVAVEVPTSVVTMTHLVQAMGRQLLKSGKVPTAADFREYHRLVTV